MDDKFIYYIVLGAIYLISRMLKKKKPVKPIPSRQEQVEEEKYYEPEAHEPAPQKPASFEDLLKEISQEFTDRRAPEPAISVVEEPVEVIETAADLREPTREEKYVKRRHQEMEAEQRVKNLKRIEAEENEHEQHAVLELLEEDGGAANAVILSEILNKKY